MLSAAESWNSPAIAEMLSASSNSVVLSILWAGRYKISNNLISTSKFHSFPELAAPLMWIYRDQVRGPLWERKIWVESCPLPQVLNLHTGWLLVKDAWWRITGMFFFRTLPGTTWSVVFLGWVFTSCACGSILCPPFTTHEESPASLNFEFQIAYQNFSCRAKNCTTDLLSVTENEEDVLHCIPGTRYTENNRTRMVEQGSCHYSYDLHRLMHLNTCFPVGVTVWRKLWNF